MRHANIAIALLLTSSLTLCAGIFAQSQTAVRIHLVDSETGFAIPNNRVKVNLETLQTPNERAGIVTLKSTQGVEKLVVSADGYYPFEANYGPVSENVPIEIRLRPVNLPAEFQSDSLARLKSQGMALAVGFISDESTGGPLPQVRISSDKNGESTFSNERGFFALSIPMSKSAPPEVPVVAQLTFSKEGYGTMIRKSVELFANSAKKYRLRLSRGNEEKIIDESRFRQKESSEGEGSSTIRKQATAQNELKAFAVSLPKNIRVGIDCTTSTDCKKVVVVELEDYTKHVLPSEWIASWDTESLKSGSVAARTIGVWFTIHPKTAKYDVCNTTACQVYDPDSSQESTDKAVDATAKMVLVDGSTGDVIKAEFSAENNDAGCGDGKAGTRTSSPCIDDSVCTGKAKNGHGRGMCQNGTQRWATGKNANGTSAPGGKRKWDWIVSHYYPNYKVVTGTVSLLTSLE